MFSPFIGRHLLILALAAGNLWLSLWLVAWSGRTFPRVPLGQGIAQRALAVSYAGAAFLALLMAFVLFMDLEFSDKAKACWQVNRQWPKVQLGMTRVELVKLVGEPSQINFNDQFLYRLHPLSYTHGGVGFKNPSGREGMNEPLDEHATIESKSPDEGVAWIPADIDFFFRDQYYSLVQVFATLGLLALTVASLIPKGLHSGWAALPLYYPLLALVFGLIYEAVERGGWRFDLFLLYPLYAIVAVAWAIRVAVVAKR